MACQSQSLFAGPYLDILACLTLVERALSRLSLVPWLTRAYNVPSRRSRFYIFTLDAINNTANPPSLHDRH